jgi:hypothetical protein
MQLQGLDPKLLGQQMQFNMGVGVAGARAGGGSMGGAGMGIGGMGGGIWRRRRRGST